LVGNKTYGSYIEVFRACKQIYTHPIFFYNNPEEGGLVLDSDSADKGLQEKTDKSPLVDFEVFARRKLGVDFIVYRDLFDSLGSQEINLSYN
jgi:hypothetical protein